MAPGLEVASEAPSTSRNTACLWGRRSRDCGPRAHTGILPQASQHLPGVWPQDHRCNFRHLVQSENVGLLVQKVGVQGGEGRVLQMGGLPGCTSCCWPAVAPSRHVSTWLSVPRLVPLAPATAEGATCTVPFPGSKLSFRVLLGLFLVSWGFLTSPVLGSFDPYFCSVVCNGPLRP